jgi:hypothetical protein
VFLVDALVYKSRVKQSVLFMEVRGGKEGGEKRLGGGRRQEMKGRR